MSSNLIIPTKGENEMGMFDEIFFKTDEYDSTLVCPNGHLMSSQDFQTKSLERVGYTIEVHSSGILKSINGWDEGQRDDFEFHYSPYGIIFYAFCDGCKSRDEEGRFRYGDLYNFLMIIDKDRVRSIEKVEEY